MVLNGWSSEGEGRLDLNSARGFKDEPQLQPQLVTTPNKDQALSKMSSDEEGTRGGGAKGGLDDDVALPKATVNKLISGESFLSLFVPVVVELIISVIYRTATPRFRSFERGQRFDGRMLQRFVFHFL